jgi:hypothetical protein
MKRNIGGLPKNKILVGITACVIMHNMIIDGEGDYSLHDQG